MRSAKHAALVPIAALLFAGRAGAQADAPAAPPPVSEGRAAPRMTKAPKLVTFIDATFPAEESRSADVELALTVDAAGKVQDATVLRTAGARFDAAAVDAAKRFVFEPAEVDGHRAAVKIKYTYSFMYAAPPAPLPPAPLPVAAPPALPSPAAGPSTPAQDVTIHAAAPKPDVVSVSIPAAQARLVSGTQGDPIKVVENLPGLARPAFGSGQLVVWGSGPDDTRTYVDGVPIPALFHGSALRSTVNGDLVKSVSLSPGAYGADYGRSLGGVVRVETRDLPASGVHGYLGADTLDGSAMLSAAPSDRVRFAVAGRLGWLDRVLKGVDARDVGDYFAIPRYQDYQAKLQIALRARESLDAVVLGSNDDLTRVVPDTDPAHARSETTSTAFQRVYLRYRRELDDGSTVDVVPWIGHDGSTLDARFGANPATLDQSTWRWGLRASHTSRPMDHVRIALGADVDGSHAGVTRSGSLLIPPREGDLTVFGQPPGDDTNADTWSAGVVGVAPYAVVDLDLGPLEVSPGLRVDGYLMEASRQTPRVGQTPSIGLSHLEGAVEPRIAARLRLTPRFALLGAAGVYSQPPAPSDLSAVFGTPTLGPSSAQHATLGESLALTPTLRAEVVAFYKWMSDLPVRDPSTTPALAKALLQDGVGRSYGVQMLLRQQPWHGFFGWVAYTLSRSERRDSGASDFRLFDYDQPHVLTVVGSKEIGPWTAGLRFRYATGLPRTPVAGAFYDLKGDTYQPIFGPQNGARLPAFWQLDVRVDRAFTLENGVRVLVYAEGLNVTNRTNGEEYVYSVDYTRRGSVAGLPIVAVIGARVDL